jgi:hypothetical protein
MMKLLRAAKERGSAVYWKASTDPDHDEFHEDQMRWINAVAAHHASNQGIIFINTSAASDIYKQYHSIDHYRVHIGAVLYASKEYARLNPGIPKTMMYSSWMTQYILRHIC